MRGSESRPGDGQTVDRRFGEAALRMNIYRAATCARNYCSSLSLSLLRVRLFFPRGYYDGALCYSAVKKPRTKRGGLKVARKTD